jgi:hypothetical protein
MQLTEIKDHITEATQTAYAVLAPIDEPEPPAAEQTIDAPALAVVA